MKKIALVISLLSAGIHMSAQRLETTIKIVGGKARIAVKAVNGTINGTPTGTTFCVAIPVANASVTLESPTILDATRLPLQTSLTTGSYSDATYKYFILLWAGGSVATTFADNTEYELLELNWSGANQSFPVSLISLTDGNPSAPFLPFQWVNYLEVGGMQYSVGNFLFYQSATSGVPTQMAADYSSGTAIVTSSQLITLPVSLINFSGYKSGSKNVLKWTTANEQNNTGFEVQRSADGVNYAPIGFVDTRAPGGTSTTELNYVFDDNSPLAAKRSYYRLRQVDIDSRSKLSNIVVINSDKTNALAISGLFPNPATQLVNVIVDAPQREDVTVTVTDMLGKILSQKLVNVETGANTIPVDVSKLAQGIYLVKVMSRSSTGEPAVSRFVKQQ